MPFLYTWDDTVPAGSQPANTIDDHIRRLRVEIHERMDSAFVDDWTADPLVLKSSLVGGATGRQICFPASLGIVDTSAALDLEGSSYEGIGVTVRVIFPLVLPHGITITKIEAEIDKRGTADVIWNLWRKAIGGAATLLHTVHHTAVGQVVSDTGAITEVVDGAYAYYIESPTGTSVRNFFGFRVTYDRTSSVDAY